MNFQRESTTFIILFSLFNNVIAQSNEEDFASLNYSGTIYNRGSSAAAFLEIGAGSRAIALGGAYAASADDLTCMYWNPAGLGWIKKAGISVNHANWLAETNFEYFAIAIPLNDQNVIGINLTVLDYIKNQPVRTIIQPEGTGEFYGASDMALGLTYSKILYDRFSFGITAKYIRQEIWHEKALGYAMDLGIHYKTRLDGLAIGSSISNFGGELKLGGRDLLRAFDDDQLNYSNDKLNVQHTTDSFPLPLIIRSGISYNKKLFLNSSVTCMVDLIHPSNNIETLNAGIEFTFLRYLSLRAGYQSLFDDSSESGLSLGVGVLSKSKGNFPLGIHYTYSVWGILNDVHRFSIDWSIAN